MLYLYTLTLVYKGRQEGNKWSWKFVSVAFFFFSTVAVGDAVLTNVMAEALNQYSGLLLHNHLRHSTFCQFSPCTSLQKPPQFTFKGIFLSLYTCGCVGKHVRLQMSCTRLMRLAFCEAAIHIDRVHILKPRPRLWCRFGGRTHLIFLSNTVFLAWKNI